MSNCFTRLVFGKCEYSEDCPLFDEAVLTCVLGPFVEGSKRRCGKFRDLSVSAGRR
jgi:hypothetical protein